jgi:hypothetical protein
MNQTMQPMIVSNAGNSRPCEDRNMFNFVITFTDSFKFIIRNGVDLQQDHHGARVWRNIIVLGSRGSTSK